MMEIEAMTDNEVIQELLQLQESFTDDDYTRLEFHLALKAGCLGWTGDPICQPPRSVLACARTVQAERQPVV